MVKTDVIEEMLDKIAHAAESLGVEAEIHLLKEELQKTNKSLQVLTHFVAASLVHNSSAASLEFLMSRASNYVKIVEELTSTNEPDALKQKN